MRNRGKNLTTPEATKKLEALPGVVTKRRFRELLKEFGVKDETLRKRLKKLGKSVEPSSSVYQNASLRQKDIDKLPQVVEPYEVGRLARRHDVSETTIRRDIRLAGKDIRAKEQPRSPRVTKIEKMLLLGIDEQTIERLMTATSSELKVIKKRLDKEIEEILETAMHEPVTPDKPVRHLAQA
tara:strand:- start:127084 stop:127629 length:546 start_codon:yes stop_codon:yes gene_type:complete